MLEDLNTKTQAVDGYLAAGRVTRRAARRRSWARRPGRCTWTSASPSSGCAARSSRARASGAISACAGARPRTRGSRSTLSIPPEARDLRLTPAAPHLYRIAQEALTNIRKHAGATRVRVPMRRPPRALSYASGTMAAAWRSATPSATSRATGCGRCASERRPSAPPSMSAQGPGGGTPRARPAAGRAPGCLWTW